MRKLLVKARTRIGAVVIGGAVVVLGAGGLATAAVMTPASDEVSDVAPVTTEPVETTAAPEAQTATDAPAPVPADSPVVDTPAATVEGVTEPTSAPVPSSPSETSSPNDGIGTTGPDGNYTPAPPIQNPGEPPIEAELPPPGTPGGTWDPSS